MVDKKLREGITEVLEILENVDNVFINKLPKKLQEFLKQNQSTSYIPNLDYTKNLKELNLRSETKDLLSIMYLNYWSTEKEKSDYVKLLNKNKDKYQEHIQKKYNPNNLF